MDLISNFISRYRKEYDFYEQACRMIAQILDSNLQATGIRAIVTSRAKNPNRLEVKVKQRHEKINYASVDDIYEDIVDLAGVRVALYFPAEREEVGRIIANLFQTESPPKNFPTKNLSNENISSYEKRFSGYWATHYRVRLFEKTLNESQKRFIEARVEIQVASVLMHAWSEVEHDLIYKPLQGKLSEDEYAILDELNGLVLAGEIALERLQRAGEIRVSSKNNKYENHYELASSLVEMAREKLVDLNVQDETLGRVDLLFNLLLSLNLNTPEQLGKYVDALHSDFERRPLAEQVIDKILLEDADRYSTYESIRILHSILVSKDTDSPRDLQSEAIGKFMSMWIKYEQLVRGLVKSKSPERILMPSYRILESIGNITDDIKESAFRIRRFRNMLVHGVEIPETDYINIQTEDLKLIIEKIEKINKKKTPVKRKNKK